MGKRTAIVAVVLGLGALGSGAMFRGMLASGGDPGLGAAEPPAEADAPTGGNDRELGCVGYCFNAFIESVNRRNPRIATVSIPSEDGTRTAALVYRSRISKGPRETARGTVLLRFACFDRPDRPGRMPRFDDCVQMAAE